MSEKGSRETRIDLVRGLSLLLIFAGHSNFVFSLGLQQSRGFADASELFVMMAGMSAALAYHPLQSRRAIPLRRVMARVAGLYGVHLLLVFALLAFVSLPSPSDPSRFLIENGDVLAVWGVSDFRPTPTHGVDALLLRYMPADLDILPLYVAIMALLPLVILAEKVSGRLLLFGSAALWLVAGAAHLNFVNLAQANGHWFFDPLCWQFVFVLGFLSGIRVKLGLEPFPFRPPLFRLACAFALLSIPANLALQFTPFGRDLLARHHLLTAILVSKSFCGVLRLLDALAIVYILWNLALVRQAARARWLEPVRSAGRHSLPVFAAGLVLSTAMQGLMASGLKVPLLLQIVLLVLGCLAHFLVASHRERKRRTPAASAPPASVSTAAAP